MEYVKAKTILTRAKSPGAWFGMDYNMNLYKGCCHGCIYCDSRSECYGIENFDQVKAKQDSLRILRDELRCRTKRGVVATGAMSDPYNPFEENEQLIRHSLELLDAFGFGAAIATKSTLLLRDIDILTEIKSHSPVLAKVTITTCDDELAKKIEPGVPPSSKRFAMLEELSEQGIFSGILLMPVLPFLEDTKDNIRGIIEQAKQSGAHFIYPAFGMTLRGNQRAFYFQRLEEIFPEQDLTNRYIKRFGNKYTCTSPKAKELYHFFAAECEKRGILYRMKDIIHQYKAPYQMNQLSIFDL